MSDCHNLLYIKLFSEKYIHSVEFEIITHNLQNYTFYNLTFLFI